jgi:uncharacterized protein YbaP (TraB family)
LLAALLAAPLPLTAAPAWELVTDNGRIVLLGSVHFLRADDHPLPAVIDAEYARAETIVLELDLDDIDELEIQQLARQLGTSPEYTGLTAALGAENFEAAQALALGIGINLRLLEPLEPWLAAITITSLRLVQLGYEPAHGVESYLVRQAARDSKEIIGLETAADQFYALDGLPACSRH